MKNNDIIVLADDTIRLAEERLRFVMYLLGDINVDYFSKYNNALTEDRLSIAWDYPHYTGLFDVAYTYLSVLLEDLQNCITELNTTKRAENNE